MSAPGDTLPAPPRIVETSNNREIPADLWSIRSYFATWRRKLEMNIEHNRVKASLRADGKDVEEIPREDFNYEHKVIVKPGQHLAVSVTVPKVVFPEAEGDQDRPRCLNLAWYADGVKVDSACVTAEAFDGKKLSTQIDFSSAYFYEGSEWFTSDGLCVVKLDRETLGEAETSVIEHRGAKLIGSVRAVVKECIHHNGEYDFTEHESGRVGGKINEQIVDSPRQNLACGLGNTSRCQKPSYVVCHVSDPQPTFQKVWRLIVDKSTPPPHNAPTFVSAREEAMTETSKNKSVGMADQVHSKPDERIDIITLDQETPSAPTEPLSPVNGHAADVDTPLPSIEPAQSIEHTTVSNVRPDVSFKELLDRFVDLRKDRVNSIKAIYKSERQDVIAAHDKQDENILSLFQVTQKRKRETGDDDGDNDEDKQVAELRTKIARMSTPTIRADQDDENDENDAAKKRSQARGKDPARRQPKPKKDEARPSTNGPNSGRDSKQSDDPNNDKGEKAGQQARGGNTKPKGKKGEQAQAVELPRNPTRYGRVPKTVNRLG